MDGHRPSRSRHKTTVLVQAVIHQFSKTDGEKVKQQLPFFVSILSEMHGKNLLSFPIRFALEKWARHLSCHEEIAAAVGLVARPLNLQGSPRERKLPLTILSSVFSRNLAFFEDTFRAVSG